MNRLQAACRRALCLPIRAYQYTLSPVSYTHLTLPTIA